MANISSENYDFPSGLNLRLEFKEQALHGEGKAALTVSGPNGLIIEMYFEDGKLDRDGAPALYIKSGKGSVEVHFRDGRTVSGMSTRSLKP